MPDIRIDSPSPARNGEGRAANRSGQVKRIGITGSVGKTSTKEYAYRLLSSYFKVMQTPGSLNRPRDIRFAVASLRSHTRVLLAELGARGPDSLDPSIRQLQPDISVITTVRNDHYSAFRGAENVYKEKVKLVDALTDSGIAVLNRDDERVWSMRSHCVGRVVSYGEHPESMVRAENVTAIWPGYLNFDLVFGASRHTISTRISGHSHLGSLLAAFAIVVALELPLTPAVQAAASLQNHFRRLSEWRRDDGVVFFRDDWKAPYDSVHESIEFLNNAQADRKMLILGKMADYAGSESSKMRTMFRNVDDSVGRVVIVHSKGPVYFRKHSYGGDNRLQVFAGVRQASQYVNDYVREGDLVLVKTNANFHLERILLDQAQNPVECWKSTCRRKITCEKCGKLRSSRQDH